MMLRERLAGVLEACALWLRHGRTRGLRSHQLMDQLMLELRRDYETRAYYNVAESERHALGRALIEMGALLADRAIAEEEAREANDMES